MKNGNSLPDRGFLGSWLIDGLGGGLVGIRALWKTRTPTSTAKITSKDNGLHVKVILVVSIKVLQSPARKASQPCQATPGPTTTELIGKRLHKDLHKNNMCP